MATVYLAEDLKHQRKVALEVLKPELAAVVGAERFLAEIQTTANLQHPHILPLFDSGEAAGGPEGGRFLFFVMPYVEGVLPRYGGSAPRLMSVSFDADPVTRRFAVQSRNVVMDWPYFVDAAANYDVSPDGSRFLAIETGEGGNSAQPTELTVVDNWFQDVRERMGGP